MKHLLLSVLVMASCSETPSQSPERKQSESLADVVARARASTFNVFVGATVGQAGLGLNISDEGVSGGTAVVWRNDWLVTAAHVVDDERRVFVVGEDGVIRQPDEIRLLPGVDVAVLHVSGVTGPVEHARTPARLGDQVFAVGAGFNQMGVVSGIVSALHVGDDDSIQFDAQINPGYSGGGLFNAQGEFLALAHESLARSHRIPGVSWGLNLWLVERVADGLIDGRDLQLIGALDGFSFGQCWASPAAHERFRFVAPCCAVITSGGSGLEVGDQVVAIRGEACNAFPEVTLRFAVATNADAAKVDIYREGRPMTVTVPLTSKFRAVSRRP